MQTQESDFGDFEEIKKEEDKNTEQSTTPQLPSRIREPRKGQLIGIIVQRLGGNRMEVKATDGKLRNCRVPGRYKRRLWLRPKNIILIEPWEDNDEKADVVYKYPPAAVNQLRKKGILAVFTEEF